MLKLLFCSKGPHTGCKLVCQHYLYIIWGLCVKIGYEKAIKSQNFQGILWWPF